MIKQIRASKYYACVTIWIICLIIMVNALPCVLSSGNDQPMTGNFRKKYEICSVVCLALHMTFTTLALILDIHTAIDSTINCQV